MKTKILKHKNLFMIFSISLFSLILMSPQILRHGVILDSDVAFHFNRIFDTSQQIKKLNFNYFQSNYGFQQSGRIVNALYGTYMAYVLGAILLISKTWFNFELLTMFLIYLISGYGIYKISRKLGIDYFLSIISALIFMSSSNLQAWVGTTGTAAVWFSALGIAASIFVILNGLNMILDKNQPINWFYLGISVAVVIEIHNLSAILTILNLIPLFIFGFYKSSNKKQMIFSLLKSVLLALALTANIWGAIFEVFGSNYIVPTFPNPNMGTGALQFSFGNTNSINFGLIPMFILLFQIIYISIFKTSTINKLITTISAAFLIFSSNIIPWTYIGIRFQSLQSYIQFPERFSHDSLILLIPAFFISLSELNKKTEKVKMINRNFPIILSFIVIMFSTFGSMNQINDKITYFKNNNNIVNFNENYYLKNNNPNYIRHTFFDLDNSKFIKTFEKRVPDYVPAYPNKISYQEQMMAIPYVDYGNQIIVPNNSGKFTKTVNKETLNVKWNSTTNEKTQIPIVIYKHSVLSLNGKKIDHKNLNLSRIGVPTVESKIGTNKISLNYEPSNLFNILLILSLFAWAIMPFLLIYKKLKAKF